MILAVRVFAECTDSINFQISCFIILIYINFNVTSHIAIGIRASLKVSTRMLSFNLAYRPFLNLEIFMF